MSELPEQLSGARDHIDADFDAAAVERGLAGLSRRIARRKRIGQGGAGLAVLSAAVLIWFGLQPAQLAQVASGENELRTADGSVATRAAETSLLIERDTADEVALQLASGKGHFEVTRNPRRRYRVHAGRVDVQVLGTGFDVERRGEQTFVRVAHGLVKVTWSDGSALLHSGQQGLFPPAQPVVHAQPASEPPVATQPVAPEEGAQLQPLPVDMRSSAHEQKRDGWRKLARAGKHREAFGTLGKHPVEDLEGLLLASDAARLSGHPREAVAYLQRLVQRYPKSAPARLAAFTLGRLALNELNEPALAARSFARAYKLDPRGPLAEDALAREAEAYHRAGDAERAKSAAQRYLTRFPAGTHAQELSPYVR